MEEREVTSCVHIKGIWFSYQATFRGEKLKYFHVYNNGKLVPDPEDIEFRFPARDGWFYQTLYDHVKADAERQLQEILDIEQEARKCAA